MSSTPTTLAPSRPLHGVFSILNDFDHPFIMVGRYALRWMGIPVLLDETIDILVRTSQQSDILSGLLRSGDWEEIDDKNSDAGLQRRYDRRVKRVGEDFYINLCREDLYKLSIGSKKIEVPDCLVLNAVLIEAEFHPDLEHRTCGPRLITDRGIRFLPHISAQDASIDSRIPIFIPTIPSYLDSCFERAVYEEGNLPCLSSYYGPMTDIYHFLRYLLLEKSHQLENLVPKLAARSREELGKLLNRRKEFEKRREYRLLPEARERRRQRVLEWRSNEGISLESGGRG